MSMAKYGLCFDPNDPDLSISEQDTIGSFVLGKDGEAVTSTTIDATTEALDVNIAGGTISVTSGSEYAEDSAHADTDLGSYILSVREDTLTASTSADGDYQSFKSDSMGRIYTTDDQAIAQLTDINSELDGITTLVTAGNALLTTIDSELDAQTALLTSIDTCLSDVKNTAGDAVRVEGDFSSVCNIAVVSSQADISNTASSVVASALTDRKTLWIANEGKATAYIGGTGVTSATGFPLYRKTAIEISAGAAVDIQAITDSTVNADIRTLELS